MDMNTSADSLNKRRDFHHSTKGRGILYSEELVRLAARYKIDAKPFSKAIARNCNFIFFHGLDGFNIAYAQLGNSRPISLGPEFIQRYFFLNALILTDQTDHFQLRTLENTPKVLSRSIGYSLLKATVEQIINQNDEIFEGFRLPVSKTNTEYYTVISEPMSFSQILSFLEIDKFSPHTDIFETIEEVCHKIELVWSNAMKFNPTNHPLYQRAKRCSRVSPVLFYNFLNIWEETRAKYLNEESFPFKKIDFIAIMNLVSNGPSMQPLVENTQTKRRKSETIKSKRKKKKTIPTPTNLYESRVHALDSGINLFISKLDQVDSFVETFKSAVSR